MGAHPHTCVLPCTPKKPEDSICTLLGAHDTQRSSSAASVATHVSAHRDEPASARRHADLAYFEGETRGGALGGRVVAATAWQGGVGCVCGVKGGGRGGRAWGGRLLSASLAPLREPMLLCPQCAFCYVPSSPCPPSLEMPNLFTIPAAPCLGQPPSRSLVSPAST